MHWFITLLQIIIALCKTQYLMKGKKDYPLLKTKDNLKSIKSIKEALRVISLNYSLISFNIWVRNRVIATTHCWKIVWWDPLIPIKNLKLWVSSTITISYLITENKKYLNTLAPLLAYISVRQVNLEFKVRPLSNMHFLQVKISEGQVVLMWFQKLKKKRKRKNQNCRMSSYLKN